MTKDSNQVTCGYCHMFRFDKERNTSAYSVVAGWCERKNEPTSYSSFVCPYFSLKRGLHTTKNIPEKNKAPSSF